MDLRIVGNSAERFGAVGELLFADAVGAFHDSESNRHGSYDAAGNQLSVTGSNLSYDAENRITTVSQPGIGTVTYTYDGNGRRVMKTSSSGTSGNFGDGEIWYEVVF